MKLLIFLKITPTFHFHAHFEAFLESARGTSLSTGFVHMTIRLARTLVLLLVLDGAFEEALKIVYYVI